MRCSNWPALTARATRRGTSPRAPKTKVCRCAPHCVKSGADFKQALFVVDVSVGMPVMQKDIFQMNIAILNATWIAPPSYQPPLLLPWMCESLMCTKTVHMQKMTCLVMQNQETLQLLAKEWFRECRISQIHQVRGRSRCFCPQGALESRTIIPQSCYQQKKFFSSHVYS